MLLRTLRGGLAPARLRDPGEAGRVLPACAAPPVLSSRGPSCSGCQWARSCGVVGVAGVGWVEALWPCWWKEVSGGQRSAAPP